MIATLHPPVIEYPADGSICPVMRLVWQPLQLPPPAPATAQLAGKRIVITGGTAPTASRIATTLRRYGAIPYHYPQPGLDEPSALIHLRDNLGTPDGIIDLNVEGVFALEDRDVWEQPLSRSVALLQSCYDVWAAATDAKQLFYMPVTWMDGQMGLSGEPVTQPLSGIWAGLAKNLPRELPNCNVRILDLAPDDVAQIDEIIARELYSWGLFEVGYRRGVRYGLLVEQMRSVPATIQLDQQDVILISGGSRGIGFVLARELAQNFLCRVIVTGRHTPPSGTEPWLLLDEDDFRRYQQQLLQQLPAGKTVAALKRDIAQIKARRELYMNLSAAADAGLRIEYHVCDFTALSQVQQLFVTIGPSLSGVIHNAGIDSPARLNKKSIDSCIATVRVKVGGFLNIVHALGAHPLKLFCNVGSIAGRWGGMIGQVDYSAANEGLARLGYWGAAALGLPIKTICWTTWEQLGMITNFEVALKYTSAINVAEGLYHWQRELLSSQTGEVAFVGRLAKAVSPIDLVGYRLTTSDFPGFDDLCSRHFYLGDVLAFKQFDSIHTRHRLAVKTTPCIGALNVAGQPALPVSLLLEFALSISQWVGPVGWSTLYVHEIRDLLVDLSALQCPTAEYLFDQEAYGYWQDETWVVHVKLTSPHPASPACIAELRLMYRAVPLPAGTAPLDTPHTGTPITLDSTSTYAWSPALIEPAQWYASSNAMFFSDVTPCLASDLWTLPYPPAAVLPTAQLEQIIQASTALSQTERLDTVLEIPAIHFFGGTTPGRRIVGCLTDRSWNILDQEGLVSLSIAGLKLDRQRDELVLATEQI